MQPSQYTSRKRHAIQRYGDRRTDLNNVSHSEPSGPGRPLYRAAAVEAKQTQWLGDIVLIRPLSFSFMAAFAAVFGCLVIAFLIFGVYTKRSTVAGQLVFASAAGVRLQARLDVPGKAIGFVKPGDAVIVRYQAYPYQKFGHFRGTVSAVSKTPVPGDELNGAGNLRGARASAANQAIYRVTVDLAAQSVSAYGALQPLQAGMLLQADLFQDRRRLYQWVLAPLYGRSGTP